jgi:enoyl-[acyl-carrier-protein] reductase (NADH)
VTPHDLDDRLGVRTDVLELDVALPDDLAAETLQTAAWSLAAVTSVLRPLLQRGSSVVALCFDTTGQVLHVDGGAHVVGT